MKRVHGFHTAGDVAPAPAGAGNTARDPTRQAAPSVDSPQFKNVFRHLTATALLSMDELAFHAAKQWIDDDQLGRRHTTLFHDFSAKGTGEHIDRSRQWTSHGFAELEATKVFRQRPQPRNPDTGRFDQTRPKLLGNCPQFWQLAKAKYAYLCIKDGLPIRNKKGKILYQAPKQTLAEQRGPLPARSRPRPGKVAPIRPVRRDPDPSEAEQWAALTESQRRWVLQVDLPGFAPPG